MIDVTRPASPVILGVLPVVARGEQLYVLPASDASGDWLALLTQPECRWDATEIVLVQSTDRGPQAGVNVMLPGYPVESRLVGNVLVVASQGWTNRPVSASIPKGPQSSSR